MIAEKLRKAILQAAMQGKLTEQLPEDGDARDLLAEIQQKKQRKIKAGEIKATKPLPSVDPDEVPYEIPENWVWTKFGNICNFQMGKTPSRQQLEYWNNGSVNWVSISDMVSNGETISTKEHITDKALQECFGGYYCKPGTLLMSFKLSIGKVTILQTNALHNEAIISVFPYCTEKESKIIKYYLFNFLPLISQTGSKKNAIKGATLNSKSISNLLIPLPPINEQNRIISCLKSLLPQIDALEKVEKELEILEKDFPEKLKKSILQAAMQGKLTEQLPEDGDARELLAEIQQEKKRKIKAGEIKAAKPLPPIDPDEILYEIPENWVWTRLGEIGEIIGGGTPKTTKPEYWNSGTIEWITPADMKFNLGMFISGGARRITKLGLEQSSAQLLPEGSIVYSSRAPIGYIAIASNPLATNQGFKSIKFIRKGLEKYLYYALIAMTPEIIKMGSGTTFLEISGSLFSQVQLPLPPMAEQQRIVDALDKLLPLCEEIMQL